MSLLNPSPEIPNIGFNEKTYRIPMNLIKEEFCDLSITN